MKNLELENENKDISIILGLKILLLMYMVEKILHKQMKIQTKNYSYKDVQNATEIRALLTVRWQVPHKSKAKAFR